MSQGLHDIKKFSPKAHWASVLRCSKPPPPPRASADLVVPLSIRPHDCSENVLPSDWPLKRKITNLSLWPSIVSLILAAKPTAGRKAWQATLHPGAGHGVRETPVGASSRPRAAAPLGEAVDSPGKGKGGLVVRRASLIHTRPLLAWTPGAAGERRPAQGREPGT